MGLGIPDATVHLADGNYLQSGCRRHSCDEKAAIIVTPTGAMLAAGLIYFPCSLPPSLADNCELIPRLMVFEKRGNSQPVLLRELQDWAEHEGQIKATETKLLP